MHEIVCKICRDDIFGSLYLDMIDVNESQKKLFSLIQKELSSEFPDTHIELAINKYNTTMIDGIISHPAISHINSIIEKNIKRKRRWVVKKVNYSV